MNDVLQECLVTAGVAVCAKTADKRVLYQNDCCRKICGEQQGKRCTTGCMELYAHDDSQQWKGWGSRMYSNSFLHGGYFDVMLLCSAESIITFLQPLSDKYRMADAYYRHKGLTDREFEIVSLIVRGESNPQICELLSISRATLRTHLNNAYRKCRELGEEPKYVPANRQQFGRALCAAGEASSSES